MPGASQPSDRVGRVLATNVGGRTQAALLLRRESLVPGGIGMSSSVRQRGPARARRTH